MTVSFGLIGAGWRAQFFAKLSSLFPDRYELSTTVVRDKQKARAWEKKWNCPTVGSIDELEEEKELDFVVTSIPREVNSQVIMELVENGLPVLSETPPADRIEELENLYTFVRDHSGNVQVAEQYHLRPHHQVQFKIAHEGIIGTPNYTLISDGHGYHGISLLRKALNISSEIAEIWSQSIETPILKGPDRSGFQNREKIETSYQNIYYFKFSNNNYGLIDFSYDQYFGFIRSERILIRGERGEIFNDKVSWMMDHRNPRQSEIERIETGQKSDINSKSLHSIQFNGIEYYRNPYHSEPLSDEEIAVAHCLDKMANWVTSHKEFYPLADACQDHYLYLKGLQSQEEGRMIETEPMIWNADI